MNVVKAIETSEELIKLRPNFTSSDFKPSSTRNLINIEAGPHSFVGEGGSNGTNDRIKFYNENQGVA